MSNAVCPVCGDTVVTWAMHREAEPMDEFRLALVAGHVKLIPCGCLLRGDETFVATFVDDVLVRVEGEATAG